MDRTDPFERYSEFSVLHCAVGPLGGPVFPLVLMQGLLYIHMLIPVFEINNYRSI